VFWKRKGKTSDDSAQEAEKGAEERESAQQDAQEEGSQEQAGPESVECVETSGVFEFREAEYSFTNNTWIVPTGEDEVVVVDPAHDAKAILEVVGDREVVLVACTNGYAPHIAAAVEVAESADAPVALHRRELRSWRKLHGIEHPVDAEVEDGGAFEDLGIKVLGIPGTSPGSVAYYFEELGVVCSGDTLLKGELGTVGDDYLDYTQQLASVGEQLLDLPKETVILPDRGERTTVAAESKNFDGWVKGE
jgi:glyoxylase-like metal-dependent hydrolase (beta-lactamase superfamily II)